MRKTTLSLLLALTIAQPAFADPAYKLSLEVEVPIILISGALASGFLVLSEGEAPDCAPLCDASRINGFDRGSAGNFSESWGTIGDAATFSTILIGPAMLMVFNGLGDGLNDTLVVGEAALASSALQVLTSYAVKRPRPRVYGDEAPIDDRNDGNAGRSFFSGHVANGVAATFATAIAFYRLDKPVLAVVSLGVGLLGSAFVGIARIGSGSHFPSDVLVGAAAGAGIGIAIPALHAGNMRLAPLAVEDASGLSIQGRF